MIQVLGDKLVRLPNIIVGGKSLRLLANEGVHELYSKIVKAQDGNRILDSFIYMDKDRHTRVVVSLDEMEPHGRLLHASISHQTVDPSWQEIKDMKDQVFGDVAVMMVLPKKEYYVNVHRHCFHLWQMPIPWEIA